MTAPSKTTEREDDPRARLEYQPRTPERLIEILEAEGENPRSWQRESAAFIRATLRRALPPQPTGDVEGLVEQAAAILYGDGWETKATASNKRYCREKAEAMLRPVISRIAEAEQELHGYKQTSCSRARAEAAEARVAELEIRLSYPEGLANQIKDYLDDAPMDGRHSDAAGADAYELLREAAAALSTVAGEEK